MMRTTTSLSLLLLVFTTITITSVVSGFTVTPATTVASVSVASSSSSRLFAVKIGKNYEPKWKKKETLASLDGSDNMDLASKGLIGNIPVVFTQGNVTKTTMALAGQPISDVATQANQFIKYACKKGECGTCECRMGDKWVRPCVDTIPASLLPGQELHITVKAIKAKAASSGKFYSFRSFIMGFYNNLLGMVGFVKMRREAKKNFQDRIEYEDTIRRLTLEKRAARLAREAEQQQQQASKNHNQWQQHGFDDILKGIDDMFAGLEIFGEQSSSRKSFTP